MNALALLRAFAELLNAILASEKPEKAIERALLAAKAKQSLRERFK